MKRKDFVCGVCCVIRERTYTGHGLRCDKNSDDDSFHRAELKVFQFKIRRRLDLKNRGRPQDATVINPGWNLVKLTEMSHESSGTLLMD